MGWHPGGVKVLINSQSRRGYSLAFAHYKHDCGLCLHLFFCWWLCHREVSIYHHIILIKSLRFWCFNLFYFLFLTCRQIQNFFGACVLGSWKLYWLLQIWEKTCNPSGICGLHTWISGHGGVTNQSCERSGIKAQGNFPTLPQCAGAAGWENCGGDGNRDGEYVHPRLHGRDQPSWAERFPRCFFSGKPAVCCFYGLSLFSLFRWWSALAKWLLQ